MDSLELLALAQRAGRKAAQGDRWLADDLAGHVLEMFLKAPPAHEGIEAWAVTVAKNKRVDVARQEQRMHGPGITESMLDLVLGPGWSPSMQVMGLDAVVRALRDLTTLEQEVLLLRTIGLPAAEVGQRLSISSARVDRVLSDARKKAKLTLADTFPGLLP